MNGIFHDDHEVYTRTRGTDEWQWAGTFATKALADGFAEGFDTHTETEVRPI